MQHISRIEHGLAVSTFIHFLAVLKYYSIDHILSEEFLIIGVIKFHSISNTQILNLKLQIALHDFCSLENISEVILYHRNQQKN